MRGRGWTVALLTSALVVAVAPVAVPAIDPHDLGNAVSDWRKTCEIESRPLDVGFPFCISNYVDAVFVGDPSSIYFHMGAELRVALYDGSGGAITYGVNSSGFNSFDPVSFATKGSGAAEDPFVNRQVFTAGNPAQLRITQYTIYVHGDAGFETRYVIQNIGDGSARFRVWVIGDWITSDCGYGSFANNPKVLGTFSPVEGVVPDPNDCTWPQRYRGYGAYTIEKASSPWDRWEQGDEVFGHLNPHDAGLTNTVNEGVTRASHAVQWDDHSLQGTPLPTGDSAVFDLGWRFANALTATPFDAETLKDSLTVRVTTRFGLDGPLKGRRVAYVTTSQTTGVPKRRGFAITDERGNAQLKIPRYREYDSEEIVYFFDDDADGKRDGNELFRAGAGIDWIEEFEREEPYKTRVTMDHVDGKFRGRVVSKIDYLDHSCHDNRMIVVKEQRDGRDRTIGTAGSSAKGYWNLETARGPGSYYARVPGEWRTGLEYRDPYKCGAARATL